MPQPSRVVGERNAEWSEVGARCHIRYHGHECCLNREHVAMGFMQLGVDHDGSIFEWAL